MLFCSFSLQDIYRHYLNDIRYCMSGLLHQYIYTFQNIFRKVVFILPVYKSTFDLQIWLALFHLKTDDNLKLLWHIYVTQLVIQITKIHDKIHLLIKWSLLTALGLNLKLLVGYRIDILTEDSNKTKSLQRNSQNKKPRYIVLQNLIKFD